MVDAAAVLEALKFWRGYEGPLVTLLMYTVGIAFYAMLVWLFYQTISKRVLFADKDERPPGFWKTTLRAIRYLIVFPLISFLFVAVLAAALTFLAKSQSPTQILLISMSVVASVRTTAYLSEGAATDLAKLVPLALLGVFLVDPAFLDPYETLARLKGLLMLYPYAWRYFVAMVLLEFTLHFVYLAATAGKRRSAQRLRVKPRPTQIPPVKPKTR